MNLTNPAGLMQVRSPGGLCVAMFVGLSFNNIFILKLKKITVKLSAF